MGLVVALVLGLASLAGVGPAWAAPDPNPPPVHRAAQPAIPQRYLDQDLAWQPCAFDAAVHELAPAAPTTDCATVVVPMDWNHPGAHPDITVAISYSYATGSSRGLLTANPGGPGTPARSFTAALAVDHPELFTSFDLLGMDPRGYGDSRRLTCTARADDLSDLPATTDPRRRDAITQAAVTAGAQLLARACAGPDLSAYVSTQQTVFDLGFVRALLGYGRLNLIGYGYGARLAGGYATTYPAATAAVVLDSGASWSTDVVTDRDLVTQATELRRTQFLDWLARHDDRYHLGTTAASVGAGYEQLRAALATRADPWSLDAALTQAISTDRGFDDAADLWRVFGEVARSGEAALTAEDTATLAAVRSRLALTERGQLAAARATAASAPNGLSVDLGPVGEVVRCNDLALPDSAGGTDPTDPDGAATVPDWGYLTGPGMCEEWPDPATARSVPIGGLPPILVVASAADPTSPLTAVAAGHERTPSSVLVVLADSGQHDVALAGVSGCVDRITLTYLLAGTLPGDSVCAPNPLPGDDAVQPFGAPQVKGVALPAEVPAPSAPNAMLSAIWSDAVARA